MKKTFVIKIICFAAIFVLLFHIAGNVLGLKWSSGEMMSERYSAYEEEESVDVIYLGGSNMYADVAPAVVWHYTGITGFNLAFSDACMFLNYYQLRYALEKHTPSLVVLDITGMAVAKDPAGDNEGVFQKVISTMPDPFLKLELTADMCSHYEGVDPGLFLFPLIRYHDRWEELTEKDFDNSEVSAMYNAFGKGCYIRTDIEEQDASNFIYARWRDSIPEENMEYLEKIYGLCEEKGIDLLLTICPNMRLRKIESRTGGLFAEEKGINFLGFRTLEKLQRTGVRLEDCFYNENHLNILGQREYSKYLAKYIARNYSLKGHKDDKKIRKQWNQAYKDYKEYYKQALVEQQEGE